MGTTSVDTDLGRLPVSRPTLYRVESSNPYTSRDDEETYDCESVSALAERLQDVTGWTPEECAEEAEQIAAGRTLDWEDQETCGCVQAWRLETAGVA